MSRELIFRDTNGAKYQPVKSANRETGVLAYRVKPRGASNKATDAIEIENIEDLAKAMLIDGLPARVQPLEGGPVNYLKFGADKLSSYELDAEIAQRIGVPPEASSSTMYESPSRAEGPAALNPAALERLKQLFLSQHPDFESFAQCESFASGEGDYKRALVSEAQTLVVEMSDEGDDKLGEALLELLAGRSGLKSALIDWRAQQVVDDARKANPGLIEKAAGAMVRSNQPANAVVEFVEKIWPAIRADLPSKPYAESRMISSMLCALVWPDDILPIRSTPTDNASRMLTGRPAFSNAPLNTAELDGVLDLAHELRRVMEDQWDWGPRDLWDVQGFIWETCQKRLAPQGELDPTPVWLVTSLWGNEDGVPRFIDRGEWSLLYDNETANNRRVREMQVGDRIFLKDFVPRATDLPFDAGGGILTANRFRAEGTITEASEDGLRVGVDWEEWAEPRTWYFYTSSHAVWRLKDPRKSPSADRLRRFLLEGEEQDYDWFLNEPFWRDRLFGNTEPREEKQMQPTNLILYGPPGTGKTYRTAAEAVRLCDGTAEYGEDADGRAALMRRYGALVEARQIEFVTFHQNFSYEEFVEGLRPDVSDDAESAGGFALKPESGIFRRLAERAQKPVLRNEDGFSLDDRRIFKMSLGQANDPHSAWVFEESLDEGYALLGFKDVDWSEPRFADREEMLAELKRQFPEERVTHQMGMLKSPDRFRNQLAIGDVIVVSKGLNAFRAIGVVGGEYEYAPRDHGRYSHRRKVRWLWCEPEGVPVGELSPETRFSLDTIYELPRSRLNLSVLERLANSGGDSDETNDGRGDLLPHVLIIDEINRANISKVFGELITLIEPDKRIGMPNALKVRLPYSKREFGVPANLHIIGTMNTADRSIALLDTALRRRFRFEELAPDTGVEAFQAAEEATGLPLTAVLNTMNQRIEYLVDRDHRIGHAFFIGCETRQDVDAVMKDKVIPLLQEYFFDDWTRLAAVLGEKERGGNFLACDIIQDPMGEGGEPFKSWRVRREFDEGAYERLVKGNASNRADPSPDVAAAA